MERDQKPILSRTYPYDIIALFSAAAMVATVEQLGPSGPIKAAISFLYKRSSVTLVALIGFLVASLTS